MRDWSKAKTVLISPDRHSSLKELSRLTGKQMSRQVEDLIQEKLIEERRRAAQREAELQREAS